MEIDETSTPPNGISNVDRVMLVLSGKGGVGKSTVATQLAVGLWRKGLRVGLLDVDLCGPSVPRMLGLEGSQVHNCSEGWVPVYADPSSQRLAVMSLGFLLPSSDAAVVWRGPKKTSMLRQFLTDVRWGKLDCLVVDTPPGTSDEHLTLVESMKQVEHVERLAGAVLVTTPQLVSLSDVRRELTFCVRSGVPVLGLIENMSGFVCPNCSHCSNIFSSGGGEQLAKEQKVPFLGRLPMDPSLAQSTDSGNSFLENYGRPDFNDHLTKLTESIMTQCAITKQDVQ